MQKRLYIYLKLLKNTMKITIFSTWTLSKLICSLPLIISTWPMWRRLYCQRLYFLTISGMYIISGFFWKFSLHKAPLQKASTRQYWCARFSNTMLLNPWGGEGLCKISWKRQCTILLSVPMMDFPHDILIKAENFNTKIVLLRILHVIGKFCKLIFSGVYETSWLPSKNLSMLDRIRISLSLWWSNSRATQVSPLLR